VILAACQLTTSAQTNTAQAPVIHSSSASVRKPVHPRKAAKALAAQAQVEQAPPLPVSPPAPKPPDWPANDQPTAATVVWNSQGLHIEASNSSLGQILKDVALATGSKVEGLSSDSRLASERVFGSYGPGSARDVLAQLLDGSGYNIMMVGDQGQGTPREIVLSPLSRGETPQAAKNQTPATDESNEADEQPPPPPPPPPPANVNGPAPGAAPRTPQQIMQEMQQRQQQLEQMQQRNNPQ
jgi:hypothetical protein